MSGLIYNANTRRQSLDGVEQSHRGKDGMVMRSGPAREESVYIIVPVLNRGKKSKNTQIRAGGLRMQEWTHMQTQGFIMMCTLREEILKLQPVSSLGQ